MATFHDIHKRAIERAFNVGAQRAGDYFRVVMWEPLRAVSPYPPENDTATIVTFRRLPGARYEPADVGDRQAIAAWNERHRETPDDAWELPDFGVKA